MLKPSLLRAALALLVLTLASAAGAAAHPVRYPKTIASLRFPPPQHGFSFPNYGDELGAVNLTPVQMQWLFGPAVCVSGTGAGCVLTPAAQRWMTTQNSYMASGHCEGFSVSALMLFRGLVTPKTLGGSKVPALQLPDNATLQSFIAYAYAFQALPRVHDKVIWDIDPRGVVSFLAHHLRDHKAGWTLHLFMPDGSEGHAITPIGVLALGHQQYAIRVYDNNWPDRVRLVHVDWRRDTWSYMASINPNEKSALYRGTKDSDTLQLENMMPGIGVQPCPFCRHAATGSRAHTGRAAAATGRVFVALSGSQARGRHAHLLIRGTGGHVIGMTGQGRLVKRYPGATATLMTSGVKQWTQASEPQLDLPAGEPLAVTVTPGAQSSGAPEGVSLIGAGNVIGVDGVGGASGSTIAVTPSLNGVAFHNSAANQQSPTITLGTQTDHGALSFTVTAHDLAGQQGVGLSLDSASGALAIDPPDAGPAHVDVTVTQTQDTGAQKTFTHQDVPVSGGAPVSLNYGGWAAGDAPVTVSSEPAPSSSGSGSGSSGGTPPPSPPAVSSPGIDNVAPAVLDAGGSSDLVVTGSGFADGAQVSFSNPSITVGSTHVTSASQLEVHVSVASGSATGPGDVTVKNPDGGQVTALGGLRIDAAPSLGASTLRGAYHDTVAGAAGLAAFFPLDSALADDFTGGPSLANIGTTSPTDGGVFGDGHTVFDPASSQYLELSSNPWHAAAAFTWEGWVNWNGTDAGQWQRIFDFGSDARDAGRGPHRRQPRGQGDALRHRLELAVRRRHHRRLLRRRQRGDGVDERPGRRGPDGADDDRRGHLGRGRLGLYTMLLFVILGVFIAGLMVGRTPEFLGKKIEAREIKLTMIGTIAVPMMVLVTTALAIATKWGMPSIYDHGPQGFSETLYAYTSMGNNNGSAFAGYTGYLQPNGTNAGAYGISFANVLGGLSMLAGRFLPMLAVLAVAGLARRQAGEPAGPRHAAHRHADLRGRADRASC